MSSERNKIDTSGKEESEWVVCGDDLDLSEAENYSAMSQSYIDVGGTTSPMLCVPYSPEFELPSPDRSLHAFDEVQEEETYDSKQTPEEESVKATETATSTHEGADNNIEANDDAIVPWWKRIMTTNGLGYAAVAVGAASVLAIAVTRTSNK